MRVYVCVCLCAYISGGKTGASVRANVFAPPLCACITGQRTTETLKQKQILSIALSFIRVKH